ncbi:questin oxidase family protein [Streptomyces lonegramiae]|uniref:Questin oxidase family protein n=1 Tax=Streptomyces lonegramiae TaxID=3075524 RepID=A0ABU2XJ60_9ACTN|nr:questin oxidase family protein [Streptomyces sp. DSM 41529]MDT0545974.1 questin oxidase family protein [Streptomyces sp. DSM 41529]
MDDTSGTLDEALERLHTTGPERGGWLTNHAPMAVEALVRHGQAPSVHRWLDLYAHKLEDMPAPYATVTDANWAEALGDPRRITDWTAYFTRELADHPWREVLAQWWPRLLPGIAGGATHPVIRVGHAVRTLLLETGRAPTAGRAAAGPRAHELAHALGYWAARHAPLPPLGLLPGPAPRTPADALAAVPRIADQNGGIRDRLARITTFPAWPAPAPGALGPDEARALLAGLVRAAAHRYATHAHGEPIMLVHAVTAPNAVLRTLPALPHELWAASLDAAWSASAAVLASYAPPSAVPPGELPAVPAGSTPAERSGEVFAHAAAHGDEHVIKLADTVLDVAAMPTGESDELALAGALRACALIEPMA